MPHKTIRADMLAKARRLRRTMTPAETLLWRYIKAHRINGLGFRRQAPFGVYIADFVCMAAKLVIELDGYSHDTQHQQEQDKIRDQYFSNEGFLVLRFSNRQVMSNLEGVVEAIRQAATARMPLPPSPALPHKGGGSHTTTQLSGLGATATTTDETPASDGSNDP